MFASNYRFFSFIATALTRHVQFKAWLNHSVQIIRLNGKEEKEEERFNEDWTLSLETCFGVFLRLSFSLFPSNNCVCRNDKYSIERVSSFTLPSLSISIYLLFIVFDNFQLKSLQKNNFNEKLFEFYCEALVALWCDRC